MSNAKIMSIEAKLKRLPQEQQQYVKGLIDGALLNFQKTKDTEKTTA